MRLGSGARWSYAAFNFSGPPMFNRTKAETFLILRSSLFGAVNPSPNLSVSHVTEIRRAFLVVTSNPGIGGPPFTVVSDTQ